MTPLEKTELSNKRVLAAFNMETPDRIPIFLDGQGYFKYIDPKATLADYFRKPEYVNDLLIEAAGLPLFSEIDNTPMWGFVSKAGMQMFAAVFFAKMKLPGVELPDDSLWNVDEQGPMTEADYDTIIAKGWPYVQAELYKRIGYDPATLPPPNMEYIGKLQAKMAPLGKMTLQNNCVFPLPPYEALSAARKLNNFVRDLRRFPDKVRAALEIMENWAVEEGVKSLKAMKPSVYGVIGGTRSGSGFISPQVFERFYLPFFQKAIPAMRENNYKTLLHMDNDWGGFLHYFKQFPKGQCIWDPDQVTGMAKLKEELGDYMCITGDVPPGLTAVGTPDECYTYAKNLCKLMGKSGFIMSSGCSVPVNAKRENIEAVISATLDS
jgi:uroporphyrinogen-III decarboxylase